MRFLALLFVFAAAACAPFASAQDSTGIGTCPPAQSGQTVTCTFSQAVNVPSIALASGSSGTLSNATATSVQYTAPTHIEANSRWGGCQILPNDSYFAADISTLSVDTNSSNTLNFWQGVLPGWGLTSDVSHAYPSYADQTSPVSDAYSFYDQRHLLFPMPGAATWAWNAEGGFFRTNYAHGGSDHHTLLAQHNSNDGTCAIWESYNWLSDGFINYNPPNGRGYNGMYNLTSTATYGPSSYATLIGGVDQASLPVAAMVGNLDEIYASANCNLSTGAGCFVRHPARFTMAPGYLATGVHFWPAAYGSGTSCPTCTGAPGYGSRFRLKSSYTASGVCTSGYGAAAIWQLQHYGSMPADGGSELAASMSEMGPVDQTTGAANYFGCLNTAAKLANLEMVDTSPLWNYQGANNASFYGYEAAPSYITQGTFAVVNATTTSGGTNIHVPVPLQGVVIGTAEPYITAVAGSYSYNLAPDTWVTGTTNQGLSWTQTSGTGASSITSAGVFTPGTTPGTFSLTATSAADPSASLIINGQVIAGLAGSPAGLRQMTDPAAGSTTDGNGNTFTASAGTFCCLSVNGNGTDTGWTDVNTAQRAHVAYSYGTPLHGRFLMPNGQYTLRVITQQQWSNDCPTGNLTTDPTGGGLYPGTTGTNGIVSLALIANGQGLAHGASSTPNNVRCGTIIDPQGPVNVTNNLFWFRLEGWWPSTMGVTNAVVGSRASAWELIPSTAAPHWDIEAVPFSFALQSNFSNYPTSNGATSVAAGGSLQLWLRDWFTGYKDAVWTLSPPVGTISTTGVGTLMNGGAVVYTAPTGVQAAYQRITIKACSASHPATCATYPIHVGSDQTVITEK